MDAGAGAGSLAAAFVAETCRSPQRLESLALTAYEKDPTLAAYLNETLRACHAECRRSGIRFSAEALREDFIAAGASMLGGNLFSQQPRRSFDCAILNPPYRKIHSASEERRLLRSIGIETSNLYTGFLSIVLKLLDQGGELVAITPRSFCNGPYFRPFRRLLLETMTLRRIHVFESRDRAFQGDQVLQENIIFYAVKRPARQGKITISSSEGADDGSVALLEASYDEVILPNDPNYFIRLVTDELDRRIARRMTSFSQKLEDLGIAVSTGRVVDFRAKRFLRRNPGENTVPLIYPGHFDSGFVRWPKPEGKRPNALLMSARTEDLMVPADTYVLARRFSAKEERRRVVAAVFSPDRVRAEKVGFENHLNYYHRGGAGLSPNLAKGLAAFLNSTLLDTFFRQFNGHTQVNATDLRSLCYPNLEQLEALGSKIGHTFPDQDEIDRLIEEELIPMADAAESINPVSAKKKIEEALAVLRELGLPREQQNERSALTLLALLDLRPSSRWCAAAAPLRGITEMMNFFSQEYGKTYAPNTRETVRRHTVHQFVQAGLVARNPDCPSRPTNSPKTVYQIETIVLHLLRTYGSRTWKKRLKAYLSSAETLSRQYARERKMRRLPVRVAPGKTVTQVAGSD